MGPAGGACSTHDKSTIRFMLAVIAFAIVKAGGPGLSADP